MAAKKKTSPPRIVSSRPQPTTRAPRRQPTLAQVFAPSWGRPLTPPRPPAAVAAAAPPTAVQAPQYSLSNLPIDASYDQAIGLLQRQRDNQLAAITGERVRGLTDYGFTEGPNGTLTFDPNNPFSKAMVLKKTYDTSRRSTAQSMGAGGQLYSGAFQNSQDLLNRNQLQSEDAQQKALTEFLARNTGQRTDAGTGYELAAAQAYGDRVARFQSNPNYDPASGTLQNPAAAAAPPPAAPASTASRTAGTIKVARGFVWQQNSNGTWRKIRPVNAWGN